MEKEVWRRVSPTLNPWPGADAAGRALRDGVKMDGVVLSSKAASKRNPGTADTGNLSRPAGAGRLSGTASTRNPGAADIGKLPESLDTQSLELVDAGSLPGAEPDPCCMGTEAVTDVAVLTGFVEDEQSERRQLQALARQAPVWARQTLLTLAAQAAARARRLTAAHYLITGETYLPAICTERIYVGKWLPALRERYHSMACTAMNYARAADGTPDPCLGDLFRELSAEAFACADVVMRVLERALAG